VTERSTREILADWREHERRLADADPDGDFYGFLEVEIQRLRHEYQRVSAGAIAHSDQLRAASRESQRLLSSSADVSAQSRDLLRKMRERPTADG
jgi:hypothetical protein